MKLIREPREPQASAEYLYAPYLDANKDWHQFILGW
jgi:hypothetical protein